METIYEAAGGEAVLRRLAHAWHERVLADEVVAHAFSHGFHPHHTDRLAAYWGEALGGPARFSELYGDESAVERMHAGNGPHDDMDERAVSCFDQAMTDVGLAPGQRLYQVLHDYFSWATHTAMAHYPGSAEEVPDGLSIPRWTWDGLAPTASMGGDRTTEPGTAEVSP
jgi:hemoglobin